MRESSVALNRFGLGGRKGEAVPQEPRRWLLDQFGQFDPRPAAITSLPASPALIVQFREARAAQREMRDENPAADAAKPGTEARPDIAPELRPYRALRDVYAQAAAARTNLALTTPAPFIERLVHFWANHFAVSIDKIVTLGIAGTFEFEAIRPNVLGKFTDLLLAVERHPAMLLYLDQAQSVGPDSVLGKIAARRGNQRGLNENLAREIPTQRAKLADASTLRQAPQHFVPIAQQHRPVQLGLRDRGGRGQGRLQRQPCESPCDFGGLRKQAP